VEDYFLTGFKGRGYLNFPGLTSEKFINHPLYGRLYRSGDFGRLLSDGSLVFTGRRDDQVKLRGQRIELGEINSVLLQNPAVKDCTTMIVSDESSNQQQLIVFWVPTLISRDDGDKGHCSSVIESLFDDLRAALPNYMIPSSFIPVDSIPTTAVKKIDNRKLEKLFHEMSLEKLQSFSPSRGGSEEEREFSEPELAVAKIVSEVTRTPLQNIRTNTSLYNLGIDSISAIYLSKRLRQTGLGQLDVSVILRHGSVAQLTTAIAKRDKQAHIESSTDMESIFDKETVEQINSYFQQIGSSVESVIPCTALQEAMLSRKGSNDDGAYCNHLLFEVYGNVQNFRQAWEQMVVRHEILRTRFTTTSSATFAYAQVILEQVSLPWSYFEVSVDEIPLLIEKHKSRFIDQARDLRAMPYSITVLKDKTSGKVMLLFSIHHALHDGEAISNLLKEVEQSYAGENLAQVVQFRQFIQSMVSTDQKQSDNFWRQYLSGLSSQLLFHQPETKGRLENRLHRKHTIDLDISLQIFEKMCKEISVTPLNVFHAACARMLALYTNSSDVCFGNVFSCRTISLEGVEGIVGPCFNTLPIRIQMSSTDMNATIMKRAREINIDIMAHQLYSLRQIQKSISKGASPLFDTLVLLQPPPRDLERKLWRLVSEEGDMDFPIIIEITPSHARNNITICLHFNSQHVSSPDAEKIARDFMALIGHTIQYPSAQATDPSILVGDLPSIVTAAKDIRMAHARSNDSRTSVDLVSGAVSTEERQVREVLSSLSGYKSSVIKRETTIFQLGLDSINAVQLSVILRNLGYEISAADILEVSS
jgi:aryl carrier-like protein